MNHRLKFVLQSIAEAMVQMKTILLSYLTAWLIWCRFGVGKGKTDHFSFPFLKSSHIDPFFLKQQGTDAVSLLNIAQVTAAINLW